MNDVIKSGNIIKKIRDGKQLEEIALFARNCIFRDGPKDTLVLEILSYLKLFQPTFFEKFEDELIETMGLFFKNPSPDTLQGVVFDMYRQHIKEKYGEDYTPMQASMQVLPAGGSARRQDTLRRYLPAAHTALRPMRKALCTQ